MELVDGVHTLPVTLELEDRDVTLNPAAVETDRGVVLIDAGCPGIVDQLETGLEAAGFDWDDVWATLLTHQDVDHAGGLEDVVDRADPVVIAHRECAPYIDGRLEPIKMTDRRYPAVAVDVELTEGERVRTVAGPMEAYHTPGHAPGHLSLYFSEERLLLSGDALHAPDGTLDGPRGPLDEAKAVGSIETLATLEIERTLCYHGGFVEQGTDAIETCCQ
ncbi:MBL fold metallo-hydrolase [Natronococcus pandeyae]|uniref:MBL fold metallo-hydrolase n=1 Tax=Natronococcus pandeyae TaxID=2055836 RepID=A0A8J8Q6A9_9EURY|nr:MBL fold metallo-hydrolase [Natronococcus pandeyae]TYL39874.1 MBL fold metallo-hydrolase [Natronococcus pandeyae]